MTDLDRFESRLQARIRARGDIAERPFDAMSIARAAAAAAGRRPGAAPRTRLSGLLHRPTHGPRYETMTTTLKIAAVAVIALAVGIGLVQFRPSTNNVGSDVSPSPSPSPLAWSPASIDQDWPAPVRVEPVGNPLVIPIADGYLDPRGDIDSVEVSWIDIVQVDQACSNRDGVCVGFARGVPSELAIPGDPWIAFGLVFDMDLDGVADVRLGLDRIPAELAVDRELIPAGGDAADADNVTRGWKTDLRTGATEIGVAGDWICQCNYNGSGSLKLYPGSYPTDKHSDYRFSLIPGRFYVWASEIRDGRVVATDHAPDTGWLEVSVSPGSP